MNIREIAKAAGVSVATVSRVLNHPETVAENTKKKVQRIMEEEEYTPNWFARGLNFANTNTIGLVIPQLVDPVYSEIVKGVEDVATRKGYIIFLCDFANDQTLEKMYFEQLARRRIDGLIAVSTRAESKIFDTVTENNIPIVLVGGSSHDLGVSMVKVNYREAAADATRHLINIGYRKIAMICSDHTDPNSEEKLQGYRLALHEAGILFREEYLKIAEDKMETAYLAAKKLLEIEEPPEAMFVATDNMAIGVMDAVKDKDLKIPEDVAIVGFDNIQISKMVEPRLTTVDIPLHKLGVYGARLLFDLIESDVSEKQQIVLQTKMKIRKSCGHKERIGELF